MEFGSCRSFGVAVGLRSYGMCHMRRQFGGRLFLKMRGVGRFIFHLYNVIFLGPSCPKPVNLSAWEIFVSRVSPVRWPNCPGPITANALVWALLTTLVYKTYAFKYLHSCPTLLDKFRLHKRYEPTIQHMFYRHCCA